MMEDDERHRIDGMTNPEAVLAMIKGETVTDGRNQFRVIRDLEGRLQMQSQPRDGSVRWEVPAATRYQVVSVPIQLTREQVWHLINLLSDANREQRAMPLAQRDNNSVACNRHLLDVLSDASAHFS